jgi:hypothetical protein
MKTESIAPCGLICDLCYAFQRTKNRCGGCNSEGEKTSYCSKCKIKLCVEKKGDDKLLCNKCTKYPCQIIKNLEKRYRIKYGEYIYQNFEHIKTIGKINFVKEQEAEWKCSQCGKLLCVHSKNCKICGSINKKYPSNSL